jgi:hypothetical protein
MANGIFGVQKYLLKKDGLIYSTTAINGANKRT